MNKIIISILSAAIAEIMEMNINNFNLRKIIRITNNLIEKFGLKENIKYLIFRIKDEIKLIMMIK